MRRKLFIWISGVLNKKDMKLEKLTYELNVDFFFLLNLPSNRLKNKICFLLLSFWTTALYSGNKNISI